MSLNTDTKIHSEWDFGDDLYSSATTRGLYNPLHFVVRLRSEYNQLLSGPPKTFTSGTENMELLQAFSTYFHETIHWWQHIGSTTGLMLSFAYPAQTHANLLHLKRVLDVFGPRKSLMTFLRNGQNTIPDEAGKSLNIILNNWHDIEFNRRIILNPLRIREVVQSPMFECVGHSLAISLGHTVALLASTFDPSVDFLPDFRKWGEGFASLRQRKVRGYYPGSDIGLVPLGALHIFEGQARFNQLQYLYMGSAGDFDWVSASRTGMMGEVYTEAFRRFLEWAELKWPDTPVDPTVNLFLLVCDLAINPSDGFPFDLHHYSSFIESVDPSFRFLIFCRELAKKPHLKKTVDCCTREAFLTVANELCQKLVCKRPDELATRISNWANNHATLRTLLNEDETFQFGPDNLPVRVCFAKFIRFCIDRVKRPEFFCWPAMHLIEHGMSRVDLGESKELWNRHQPLFVSDLDGEIRPTRLSGRDDKNVYQTFNDFYFANVLYDLVRQWTVSDGPFNYDYRWLTPKYTPEMSKPFVDAQFQRVFGVKLDDFVCN